MIKQLLLVIGAAILCSSAFAQNNISLKLNHMLGDKGFEMNKRALNNISHDFDISRLQYYISEISIQHDGGIITEMVDARLLVTVSDDESTIYDFGGYDIVNVEKILWHIGVEPSLNHEDPSKYDSEDPLAPTFPSMHWGWSAGYRFIAIEGNGGPDVNLLFQLHGLGDINYLETQIETINTVDENNNIIIELNADYSRVLEDVDLYNGVVVHGEDGAAQVAIENFKNHVFVQAESVSSVSHIDGNNYFSTYPNPSFDGSINIHLETESTNGKIVITDLLGRKLKEVIIQDNSDLIINNLSKGFKILSLYIEGQQVSNQKIIIE